MILNRRQFLISTSALASLPRLHAAYAQSEVTSGGLGLTAADIESMYEELPVGQSYRNFADPVTNASMYIDFGNDDFAQSIWIDGELDEAEALDLITWLCPDDIQAMQSYELLDTAGSIAQRKAQLMHSEFLGETSDGRAGVLASYVLAPSGGSGSSLVENLWLTVEQGISRG